MEKIAPYWKAVVGFVAPGAVLLSAAVTEASKGGEHITDGEWITAILAMIITSAGVWAVPNKDPRALHQRESVQPPGA